MAMDVMHIRRVGMAVHDRFVLVVGGHGARLSDHLDGARAGGVRRARAHAHVSLAHGHAHDARSNAATHRYPSAHLRAITRL